MGLKLEPYSIVSIVKQEKIIIIVGTIKWQDRFAK